MLYLPEILIGLLLLALIVYFSYLRPRRKRKRVELLTRFRILRNRSIKMQDALSRYILENDALNNIFFNGQTYGEYLKTLQKNHSLHLSESLLLRSGNGRMIIPSINSRKLNEQEKWLSDAEKKIKSSQQNQITLS